MNDLFSLEGRYNRARYFLVSMAITGVTYGLAILAGIMMGIAGGSEDAASLVGGLIGIAANVVLAFVCVKRLHDLNRPGWHFWLFLVPLYNLYLGLVLLFSKGTSGPNEYGPDPLMS